MPTGYTHDVQQGKVTFEQFVWRCARAMGALGCGAVPDYVMTRREIRSCLRARRPTGGKR